MENENLQLTPERVEDELVMALCERNGWEYGSGDYDIAVSDVKWFIENYTRLVKGNE